MSGNAPNVTVLRRHALGSWLTAPCGQSAVILVECTKIKEVQLKMINRDEARRRRAFHRAAYAWTQSKPHQAWEILAAEGFSDHWGEFRSEMLRQVRRNFKIRMARA